MFSIEADSTSEDYTTSRMKKWFMVQFQGYEVVKEREVPKVTRQGRLTYECRWYLRSTS
ncbi:MAG: hypothetical protein L3K26_17915 [Candidatus Hydrogenedentes bacterium]|nr:hypothetical protein [Candidatus Hydrogenedentota bacterium]